MALSRSDGRSKTTKADIAMTVFVAVLILSPLWMFVLPVLVEAIVDWLMR